MQTVRLPHLLVSLGTAAALAAQPQLLLPLEPPAPVPMTMAGSGSSAAAQQALAFQRPQLGGQRLAKAISRVTRELTWHAKLEAAQLAAQQEGKPILWISALGDLKGFT